MAYVGMSTVALIVVNGVNDGAPITIGVISGHPMFWFVVIAASLGSTGILLLLTATRYTRPAKMLGVAGGTLVGMLVPAPFASQMSIGFFYAFVTMLSVIFFGWIGNLGGHLISKLFGLTGVDGDRGYWQDWG